MSRRMRPAEGDDSPLSQQRTTRLLRRLSEAGKDAQMLRARLDAAQKAALASQEQTEADGQNDDTENEDGERNLRKREFNLFLPDVGDRCDKAC